MKVFSRSSVVICSFVTSLLATSGCYTGASGDGDAAGTQASTGETTDTDDVGETAGETADDAILLPNTSRYPRLSHTQWENTVQDLFGLAEPFGLSSSFIGNPNSGGFDNNGEALQVDATLWSDYQWASEKMAEQIAADPNLLAFIVPAVDGDSDAKALAFVTTFGRRAYRRPLTEEEISRHLAIFEFGAAKPGDPDPFTSGVRLVVQAMLQSPLFLYRVEASDDTDRSGKIPLSDHEVAVRLSYMLWNTMPDAELFAAADAGKLTDPAGVDAQAARMLDHPRAHAMVAAFHYQLLHVDKYINVYKDPDRFPEYSSAMNEAMITETMMFVEHIVFDQDGDLSALLTAPYTFVNSILAPLYGVQGPSDDSFVRVDLNPSRRAGLLTQIGFLASNAGAIENDPIHRGVFINLQLLCTGLPPPPPDIPALPSSGDGQTLRERIEQHTGKAPCAGCHGTYINPLGFAFENYGPLGEWQTTDAGKPIDATAEFNFKAGKQSYDGGVELANLIADSEEAHRCYVAHLLEYGFGRHPQEADAALIDRIAAGSQAGTHSIKQIIRELTKDEAFRFRASVEE